MNKREDTEGTYEQDTFPQQNHVTDIQAELEELRQTIIEEAEAEAEAIIANARETSQAIYSSSLQYVEDMLSEVNLIAMRARQNMQNEYETMIERINMQINIVEENKHELLEQLQELAQDGEIPVKKAQYNIKVDETYMAKRGYNVKVDDGTGLRVEPHKPTKQPYEIKIADEWKDRIEQMEAEVQRYRYEAQMEPEPIPEPEPEPEEEEGFSAADFDLDAEYFAWLEESDS